MTAGFEPEHKVRVDEFTLDPRLAADSVAVIDLGLSSVRLMRDSAYVWVILVPRRAGASELIDLTPADRHQLMDEIARVSAVVRAQTGCLKLNVAAIGNIVRQLHVHVVARNEADPAWPGPVWGKHPPVPYAPEAQAQIVKTLALGLAG